MFTFLTAFYQHHKTVFTYVRVTRIHFLASILTLQKYALTRPANRIITEQEQLKTVNITLFVQGR